MRYYVFLDTNIYEESNFSFENGKFTKLKGLVKSANVVLLYNEVVYREVKQHIESYVKEAVVEYNSAVRNRGFAPFRSDENWNGHLSILDERKLIESQWQAWDVYLSQCGAIKIPTQNVNVDAILDNYFKRILPFEDKKPNEFKDAISIEAIRGYFEILKENQFADNIFVVAADKGVRKSFRNDRGIVTYDNLNKFINYIILHTEYLAIAVNKELEKGIFDKYIEGRIIDLIHLANCDVEDCYDDFDIMDVKYLNYTIGYINIIDNSLSEITLEISAEICVDYMERDEDNSPFDKEEGKYFWEEFIEYQELHKVSFEAVLKLDIGELDEETIKKKIDTYSGILEQLDKQLFEIVIEPETIFFPEGTVISMNKATLLEKEEIRNTVDDWHEEEEYTGDKTYTTCPDCGKPISFKNDGSNGFCIECASEH